MRRTQSGWRALLAVTLALVASSEAAFSQAKKPNIDRVMETLQTASTGSN